MPRTYILLFAAFALTLFAMPFAAAQTSSPADLAKLANDYYKWHQENFPVDSSDQGLHTWDNKPTNYSPEALAARRKYVQNVLTKVRAFDTDAWSKDDRIDWLLFRSQVERDEFFDRVMQFEETNPQIYVNECTNAIFSLLKKDYDAPRKRAIAARVSGRCPRYWNRANRTLSSPLACTRSWRSNPLAASIRCSKKV